MIVGSHVSTRHGYRKAAEYAAALGGNAFQYFPKNPRALQPKAYNAKDAASCKEWCAANGIVSVGHGPYGVNPAAEDEAADWMAACTLNDLQIVEACGSVGVVVHFGVYKGKDPLQGYRNIIQWIDKVTAAWDGQAKILLENQAGDHGRMGTTLEELCQVRSLCREPDKVGFCLDACHLFASGEWEPAGWDAFAERARKLGYWEALEAVHLNDSRFPAGSRKDRHAPIGEGYVGAERIRAMLSTPELRSVPFLLETPSGADGTHRDQIALARRLSGEETE